jgi:hypothetical protein
VIQDRRSNMRMKVASKDPIDDYLSELPNGGARVIKDSKPLVDDADGVNAGTLSFESDSLSLANKRRQALASTIEDDLAADFTFAAPDKESTESTATDTDLTAIEEVSEPRSDQTEADSLPDVLSSPEQTLQDVVKSFAVIDKEQALNAGSGDIADSMFDQMLVQVEQDVRSNLNDDTDSAVPPAEQLASDDVTASVDDLPALSDIDVALTSLDDSSVDSPQDDTDVDLTEPLVDIESEQRADHSGIGLATDLASATTELDSENVIQPIDGVSAAESVEANLQGQAEQPELDVVQSQVTSDNLLDNLSLSNQPGKQEQEQTAEPKSKKKYRSNPFKVPQQQSFDLGDGNVPMLIDSVAKDEDEVVDLAEMTGFVPRKTPKNAARKLVEPTPVVTPETLNSEQKTEQTPSDIIDDLVMSAVAKTDREVRPVTVGNNGSATASRDTTVDSVEPAANSKTGNKTLLDRLADIPVFGKTPAPSEEVADDTAISDEFEAPSVADYQHVQIINVRAKDSGGFNVDKLQAFFKACDIQLTRHKVYQRNEEANGRGAIQFNIANQVQSGIFAADKDGELVVPGVSFYLGLPGPTDSLAALEAMIQTAEYLAKNFDGVMKDKDGSDINKQVLDYLRQDVKEYSRKHLAESS